MTEQLPDLRLEAERLRTELEGLNSLADSFGQKIVTAFSSAIIHGKKLSDVLRDLMLSLAQSALSSALRPLGELIGGIVPGARSIAPDSGTMKSPVPSPMRGSGGVHVTVNISTPDVQGFRQSQSQVAAMLTKAVARGQRNL
jgi:hypothetical protein